MVAALVAVLALAAAAGCSSDDEVATGSTGAPSTSGAGSSVPGGPVDTDPTTDPTSDPGGDVLCVDEATYEWYGASEEEAVAKAEAEGRAWRIGREDDESFAMTADFQPGRVTFELDDGTVTFASIESETVVDVEGAQDPADVAYLGLTQDEAEARAEADGVPVRVVRINDESFPVTEDFSPDRRNLSLDGAPPCVVVTAVTRG